MRKIFTILPLLFIWAGLNHNIFSQSKTKSPIITEIDFIALDRASVFLPCKSTNANKCEEDTIVSVRVNPVRIDGKPPMVKYKVSGGKIIGSGTAVSWDLKGLSPGNYNISVQIEREKRIHTQTVSVIECEKCDEDEGVENVILDKTLAENAYPFHNEIYVNKACKNNGIINVSPIAKSSQRKVFTYYFFVMGGEIEKYGAKANWYLDKVKPGEYSITVGIGFDGVVWGKTVTKTVIVKNCEIDFFPCTCPTISVSAPSVPVSAGDSLIFTVNVSGGSEEVVKYLWVVTEGEITAGQGTPQILVKTTKKMKGHTIIATAEIGAKGACYAGSCQTVASASAEIKDK